jgi:hypothetical protein
MYYNSSLLCPICQEAEENLQHVFSCQHGTATQHRHTSLAQLLNTLQAAQTPQPIVDAIQYSFHQWWDSPTSVEVRPLTAGSLRGPDVVLTSAFLEQF